MILEDCLTADGVHRSRTRVDDVGLPAAEPQEARFVQVADVADAMPDARTSITRMRSRICDLRESCRFVAAEVFASDGWTAHNDLPDLAVRQRHNIADRTDRSLGNR